MVRFLKLFKITKVNVWNTFPGHQLNCVNIKGVLTMLSLERVNMVLSHKVFSESDGGVVMDILIHNHYIISVSLQEFLLLTLEHPRIQ